MKQFIKSIFVFVPFATVLYIVFVVIWGSVMPQVLKPNIKYRIGSYGHLNTRIKDIAHYHDIDILFIGSSKTYRGYDVRIFKEKGFASFNLGSSSQTPVQSLILLERYLDQLKPKTIIFDVCALTFSNDGVESSLDLIANDKIDIATAKMALELNDFQVYNTLINGAFRKIIGLDKNFHEPITKDNDTYIAGGFVEKEISYFKKVNYPNQKWDIKPNQIDKLDAIVQLLDTAHINLILVQSPSTANQYKSYSNNNDFDSIMNSKATYHNFNEIISLDDSLHFYDATHLNQKGVELFNKKLIQLLEEVQFEN